MNKYSILFADDHTLLRQGLISLTQNFPFIDKEKIYQAANGREAVNFVKKTQPQLIVMDVSMPEMNGLEAVDAIKNQLKPERYGGAPLLGLRGNVLKAHGSSNKEAIMNAIRIANEIVSNDLNRTILEDIEKANNIIYNAD